MSFISHIHVGIADLNRSRRFYDPLMVELGLVTRYVDPRGSWMGWGLADTENPVFFIGLPFDRQPANPGNGPMVAFTALSRSLVDRCHTLAISSGGSDEGLPGLRPHYHANYYGAYFRDPDRNKICVVCHRPE